MRHRCRVKRLGRPADQRKALLRALTTSLIREGEIITTQSRAKVLRSEVDRIVTLAKDGSLAARRRAEAYLYDEVLVRNLFDNVQERYGDRQGGYTRVVRTANRRGDNAPMAIIEMI